MSWHGSAEPDDRSGGGRRKRARGPRWVTDEAREIAGRQQAASRSERTDGRRRQPPPPPRRTPPPPPATRARSIADDDRWDDEPRGSRFGRHEPPDRRPRRHDHEHEPRHDHGPRRDRHRDHEDDRDRRDHHRDHPRGARDRDRRDPPTRPYETDSAGPRKLTVTRVAAWRSKQLTGRGLDAFRRATTADGADRSGLTAMTYPTMINYGADAAIAVALANTLFFSAATAESKTKVALYLLITIAPFALIAPVIGPLLDRLQGGRRLALAASFAGRVVLAIVMAQHFDDWLLYPAALGVMVLSRSFNVLKAAVTPRVLPPDITLTKTNSRLAVFGLAAGGVIGAVAAGFAALLGSGGALWFTAVVCAAGAYLCLRIPAWVEVTEGEIQASLRDRGAEQDDGGTTRRRREPLGKHVVVALWGSGTIRLLTGFLTLFVAFVVKAQTEQSPWAQVYLLGLVGVAAGAGSFLGNAVGARQHFDKPDQVIVACVAGVLSATVLAALVSGITTAVVVALVGSVCSAIAKVCLDATTQSDMSEESRASAFGRTETILQLSWTFGGALGVLLPPTYWIGFTVVSGVLALGLAQTVMTHRGGSLVPRFGGDRPARSPAARGLGRLRRAPARDAAPAPHADDPTAPRRAAPTGGRDVAPPAPTRRWEHES